MDYQLGITRWHIVGFANGDMDRPRLLCGRSMRGLGPGGSALDVGRSSTKVCEVCDRATGLQAAEDVREAMVFYWDDFAEETIWP